MKLPYWAWFIICGVLVLVICALCKVNVGVDNGAFHFSQGLVH